MKRLGCGSRSASARRTYPAPGSEDSAPVNRTQTRPTIRLTWRTIPISSSRATRPASGSPPQSSCPRKRASLGRQDGRSWGCGCSWRAIQRSSPWRSRCGSSPARPTRPDSVRRVPRREHGSGRSGNRRAPEARTRRGLEGLQPIWASRNAASVEKASGLRVIVPQGSFPLSPSWKWTGDRWRAGTESVYPIPPKPADAC